MKRIVLALLLISVAMVGASFVSANHDIEHINMDETAFGDISGVDGLVHINYKSPHGKSCCCSNCSNPDCGYNINYIYHSCVDCLACSS